MQAAIVVGVFVGVFRTMIAAAGSLRRVVGALGLVGVLGFMSSGVAVTPTALGAPRARTLHLNWTERQTPNLFPVPMTFHVYWVRIQGERWTVRAAFTNRSRKTLRVFREEWGDGTPTPDYGFSILDIPHQEYSVNASGSSPAIPQLIRPGMTWSGTYFGTHASWLPRRIPLQVSFGYFRVVGGGGGFAWVTQHTFRL